MYVCAYVCAYISKQGCVMCCRWDTLASYVYVVQVVMLGMFACWVT